MQSLEDLIRFSQDQFVYSSKILEEMIDVTEKYYIDVSERLPDIEEEIENTIEETNILISYFVNPEAHKHTDEEKHYLIREIIQDLEDKINEAYDNLLNKEETKQILSGFFSEGESDNMDFHEMLELIKNLQSVLKNLKNLSINANIHAHQVGKKGAGFKVVSNEINQLSTEAEKDYSKLSKEMQEFNEWYKNFKTKLESVFDQEENIKNNFKVLSEEIMKKIVGSLNTIAHLLNDFTEQIEWSVEPIGGILLLVQNQDIIRQNLENMINIMEKSSKESEKFLGKDDFNDKQTLDYLVFMMDLSNLSRRLMESIIEQLNESLLAIQERFEDIEKRLGQVLRDNDFVIEFLIGQENNLESPSTIEFIYEDIFNFIPKFKTNLDKIKSEYVNLSKEKEEFHNYLENLSESIKSINKLANRLGKIRIYARIELTRINEKKYIQDFEETIGEFVETSNKENELYNKMSKQMISNYNDFVELADENKYKLENSTISIEESSEQLHVTKQVIREAIHALSKNIDNLSREIIELNEDFSKCQELENQAKELIEIFNEINREAFELKEEYESNLEVDGWEISHDHLEELISEFTSYVERKTAKDEYEDFDVDVGSEGGDLTLF